MQEVKTNNLIERFNHLLFFIKAHILIKNKQLRRVQKRAERSESTVKVFVMLFFWRMVITLCICSKTLIFDH